VTVPLIHRELREAMDPDSPVELSSKRRRCGGAAKGHSDASGRGASQQPPAPESQQPRPTLPELQHAQPPSPWYSSAILLIILVLLFYVALGFDAQI
jgi:hypothetical protein